MEKLRVMRATMRRMSFVSLPRALVRSMSRAMTLPLGLLRVFAKTALASGLIMASKVVSVSLILFS